ncbi:hypothetical protein F511_41234 [Dorcoceras hygrometricum]|uniref:Uncharacterized protein n=1 Tax=Dorcoceras hygrometricum TaxID=472368 RepID=A0A2Z7D3L1_9LAMI|nr:hypothetical protein F511_41234 [Dorcoceras hygrometricum]
MNKIQMLCMRSGTKAEGYNQGKKPKNAMHSSMKSATEYVATTQATGALTRVDICSRLLNQTQQTPRSWYQTSPKRWRIEISRYHIIWNNSGSLRILVFVVKAGFVVLNQISRTLFVVIVAQDVKGNPGFAAGRGFNPAGGAPGGG